MRFKSKSKSKRNELQSKIEEKKTFKYSLASCLCSSKICLERSLFGSGGAGLKWGSSIKCTDAKSSSSIPPFVSDCICSVLPSKPSFDDLLAFLYVAWFVELITFPIRVRALFEDDAIALDLASAADNLSLVWPLAANKQDQT